MAGFKLRKNLDGSSQSPTLIRAIGKNSIIFTVGDTVRLNTSGNFDLSTTTEQLFGVVQSVVDTNGKAITPDADTNNTWTMASDNTSVDLYEVAVVPAFLHYLWSTDSDTTLEIASLGKYFAINGTSDGIVTSGESDTIGSLDCQFLGVDPDNDSDTSKGLYRFVNTQVGGLELGNRAA